MKEAVDKLLGIVEQRCCSQSTEEAADPLDGLTPKEIRKRFDEYGNPREGFDMDGNPIASESSDNNINPDGKAVEDGVNKRRTRWE